MKAIVLLILAQQFLYPTPATKPQTIQYKQTLSYDIYRPATTDNVPVVIFANITGAPYSTWPIYTGWANAVASAGAAAVLYQQDFDALIDSLREHASELRIDPSRVVIWAGSANVQLGLPLAMDAKRDYIRGACIFYGTANIDQIRTDLPVFYVRSGLDSPELNRNLDAIVARAIAANAPWTVENYAAGLHGFEVLNDNDVTRETIARTLSFIKSVTKPNVARSYASLADDAALGAAFNRGDWPAVVAGYRKRDDAESHRRLAIALVETKQYAEAVKEFDAAYRLGRQGIRDTAYPAARAAALGGDVKATIHWLQIAMSNARFGPTVEEIRTSDAFARVRNDPEFQRFIESR